MKTSQHSGGKSTPSEPGFYGRRQPAFQPGKVSHGGFLAFVAPGVENLGVIQAPGGSVALGSGDAFTFEANGNPLIQLVADNFISTTLVDAEGWEKCRGTANTLLYDV
jgi:hypothetical protein